MGSAEPLTTYGRAQASAPGKVILHGEHSVMFGHTAVAGSLGLRTTVTITETAPDGPRTARFVLPAVGMDASAPADAMERLLFAPARPLRSWREPEDVRHAELLTAVDAWLAEWEYARGVEGAQRTALRALLYVVAGVAADEPPRGCWTLAVESALSAGAGAGSSAALAVSAAGALLTLRRVREGGVAQPFDAADRVLLSKWAFNCERIVHGAPSGIDNATCTFGALVRFRGEEGARALELRATLRVLLVDTRVSRSTSAQTARVAQLRERHAAAAHAVLTACGHVAEDALRTLLLLSDSDDDRTTDTHYEQLAELWRMNHCLLAALGVSHPALEDVRRRALSHGLAAKLTGAGGGGYAVVLVPPRADAAARALTAELAAAGYGVTDTALGGPGVLCHP